MTLGELLKLQKSGGFRSNMGDGWEYIEEVESFTMSFCEKLGGIKVKEENNWNESCVTVYRYTNGNTEEIYNEPSTEEHDIDLKKIHIGLDKLLKRVYGY